MADSEERKTEGLKLVFEILKQQTTLDTAAALVVIALGSEVGASLTSVILPLSLFGTSIVLCLFGTSIVLCLFGMVWVSAHVDEGTESDRPLVLLAVASGTFISGLLLFALFASVLR